MITKKNFSLKNYNSFNIDVNAKEFIEINSKEELIRLSGVLKNEKITNTDEFLVKKRDPLVLPPEFETLPKPNSVKNSKKFTLEWIK